MTQHLITKAKILRNCPDPWGIQACSKFFPGNNSLSHFPDMSLTNAKSQTWTLPSCYPPMPGEQSERKILEPHTSEQFSLIFTDKKPALVFLHLSVIK